MTGADPAFEACNDAQVEVLVAERDELLAEVARLTDDLRVEQSVTHQCEAVDATIDRVRALRDDWRNRNVRAAHHAADELDHALDGEADRA